MSLTETDAPTAAMEGAPFGDADGQDARARAAAEYRLSVAIAEASRAWRDAFNAGDAAGAAALYEDDAVMVVKPFGTFNGRSEIEGFWSDIISKGFSEVVYSHTVTTILDRTSARITADWKMNHARGIITNELWVLQPDGRALLREDHFDVAH